MNQLRHNPFLITRTLCGGLAHAEWSAAWRTRGFFGLIAEFLAALAGLNTWPFFIVANYGWSPGQVRHLLAEHGVPSWGWGYHGGNYLCRVALRQAHWAQYLLLQHTVPLTGRLLTQEDRAGYAAHHTPAQAYPASVDPAPAARPAQAPAWKPLAVIDGLADTIAKL
jgi:hypothetical protein